MIEMNSQELKKGWDGREVGMVTKGQLRHSCGDRTVLHLTVAMSMFWL